MSFDLDTLYCNHAGSGEQTGKPTTAAGVPDEESTVDPKPGNLTSEFVHPQGLIYVGVITQTER